MASVIDDRRLISPYRKLLLQLSDQLRTEDVATLKHLCVDLIPRWKAENVNSGLELFDLLEQDARISEGNVALLVELFNTVDRMDMVSCIQTYLQSYNENGNENDVACVGSGLKANGGNSLVLDHNDDIGQHAAVLAATKPAQAFDTSNADEVPDGGRDGGNPLPLLDNDDGQQGAQVPAANKPVQALDVSDADEVTDGGKEQRFAACKGPTIAMRCMAPNPADNLSGQEEAPWYPDAGSDKEEEDGEEAGPSTRVKPFNPSRPTPDQPFPEPSPVHYVDFLECGGYAVKIIGGKHFKTPEGEFVEMKSGAHYKIHATNTHVEGCHLDISIDGYDIGGWVLAGHEELTIERPAEEAKKFTFYRVKTAPAEAGIESGRSENGVVSCVFTPEAYIPVAVDVPSLHQPLQIEVPPLATVGYLKRELQLQLNTADDPDQVIALKNTVLVNTSLVRHHLQPPFSENLRLLAPQLEILVEMSSGETFPVTVHPGKSKVRDVMQLIENVTNVPSDDQKLYCGRSRLSDFPKRHLPDELICDPNPKLVVIIPEYLHLNVKSQDGKIDTIKIDPEKTLRDLLKQIPCCQNLAGNQEVEFVFEGRCLNPYSERSLQVCNIKTGSTIEVKVKTNCVVRVRHPGDPSTTNITINPEETFKDLVDRFKKKNRGIDLENVTLAMGDRIFDPERDTAPLKDYGVAHDSFIAVMGRNSQDAAVFQREREEMKRMLEIQSRSLDEIEARVDRCGIQQEDVKLGAAKVVTKSLWSTIKKKCTFGFSSGSPPPARRSYRNSSFSRSRPPPPSDEGAHQTYGLMPAEKSRSMWSEFRKGRTSVGASSSSSSSCPPPPPPPPSETQGRRVTQKDPAWKAGGTTLQGDSMQLFTPAESLKVDPSRKVELLLRLVAREDEEVGAFPEDECKPLSTLYPSPVPE